MTIGRVV